METEVRFYFGFDKYENFYVSNYNGGSFYHPFTNTIIYNELQISVEDAKKITEIANKNNINFMLYYDEKAFINKVFYFNDKHLSMDSLPLQIIDIKDINKPLIKGILAQDHENLEKVVPLFEKEFPNLDFYFSQRFYLEVVQKGVNKGNALDYISKYLNIPLSEFIVLGDSENDVFMFKKVKESYAITSSEDIKKEAKYVLNSAKEPNFKNIIEKYFNLKE